MSIVQTDLPITSEKNSQYIREISKLSAFSQREILGTTAYGRPLETLSLGRGPVLLCSASHHANEWITSLVLLKFLEELSLAAEAGGAIGGTDVRGLLERMRFCTLPMVDPDGVNLVTGAIGPGDPGFENARALSGNYPEIPFPSGWKANLLGVDLNLNYPAGWLKARELKAERGFTVPGPRDFPGNAPFDQRESRLLAQWTLEKFPRAVIAFHTQGQVIYWQFGNFPVPGARALGETLARASGYALGDTPLFSSFAGYKDWFLQSFLRPGYTVECGIGTNPLPLSQFPIIYPKMRRLLLAAAQKIADGT